jgi:hypothetical protein
MKLATARLIGDQVIELNALRKVYEAARRFLRFHGVDAGKCNEAYDWMIETIEDVKQIDGGMRDPTFTEQQVMSTPAVQRLATRICEAVGKDELEAGGGCDISAGMFGPNLSTLIVELATPNPGGKHANEDTA